MRQAIFVIFLFVAFLCVIQLFTVDRTVVLHPESFISQDALLLFQQYDLEKKIDVFRKSPLGLAISGIDYTTIAGTVGLPQKDVETITTVSKNIKDALNNPLLNTLFGKEVTVAFFPFGERALASVQQKPLENVVVISRPKHYAKLVDIAARMMEGAPESNDSRYGGYVIRRLPINDHETVVAVRVKDLLLFSYNERLLRRCLDIYDNGDKNIRNLSEYRQLHERHLKSATSFLFVNLAGVKENISLALASSSFQGKELLLNDIADLNGYQSLYYGKERKKTKTFSKILVNFDPEKIKPQFRELFEIRPIEPTTFHRVSSDTIWYYWTNGLRPKTIFKLYEQSKGQKRDFSGEDFLGELASVTGIPSSDLVSLISNDITIAIKSIPINQFVPVPRFMIGIRTGNPKKLKSALDTILKHYGIPINIKTFHGTDIHSWGGIIGDGDVQPTYAFVGDYLIIASNREQIKEFIVIPKIKKSLVKSSHFKNVEKGLKEKNNSIGYIKFAEVTNMLKEIISWGGTMLALTDREAARKSKILIDQLINPLLDGMSMYTSIGTRNYIQDNKIFVELTTITERGNK